MNTLLVLLSLIFATGGATTEPAPADFTKDITISARIDVRGYLIKGQIHKFNHPKGGPLELRAYDDNSQLRLYFFKDGKAVVELPEFHTNMWSFDGINKIEIIDVTGDGNVDILVMASAMAGIGPGGAQPFAVNGVYTYSAGRYLLDSEAGTKLESVTVADMPSLIKWLKAYYK